MRAMLRHQLLVPPWYNYVEYCRRLPGLVGARELCRRGTEKNMMVAVS